MPIYLRQPPPPGGSRALGAIPRLLSGLEPSSQAGLAPLRLAIINNYLNCMIMHHLISLNTAASIPVSLQ